MTRITVYLFIVVLAIQAVLIADKYWHNDKIAYVNTSELLSRYSKMANAEEQITEVKNKYKADIDTLSRELELEISKYEKSVASFSKDEKEKSEQFLKMKQTQLIQYQQAVEKKVFEESKKLKEGVLVEMNKKITKYGKTNNYKLIFGTSEGNIIYADEVVDISEDVLNYIESN